MIEEAVSKGKIEQPDSCSNSKSLTVLMATNNEMKEEFLNKQKELSNKLENDIGALDNIINVNHAFNVGGKVLDSNNTKNIKEYIEKNQYKKPLNNIQSLSKKIEYNNTEYNIFESMVNNDNIDNNGTDLYGNTALHKVIQWAFSETKYIKYVKLLLNNNNMSKDGVNALDKSVMFIMHYSICLFWDVCVLF